MGSSSEAYREPRDSGLGTQVIYLLTRRVEFEQRMVYCPGKVGAARLGTWVWPLRDSHMLLRVCNDADPLVVCVSIRHDSTVAVVSACAET